MHLVHVISAINEEAAGPSYSVVRLCRELLDAGDELKLAVLDRIPRQSAPSFVATFPSGCGPRRLGVSPAMRDWLRAQAVSGEIGVIHNHGLWMMPNVYSAWATKETPTRFVVSPRGMLSRWALNHSKWVKRVFWHLMQSKALSAADCFHATAESEYEDIRRAGFQQPICIVPNGIDVPPLVEKLPKSKRRLLFLGRIHPNKGVDILLNAWSVVSDRFPDWELHIVGPDNRGFLPKMEGLAADLKLKRVKFRGPLYGAHKSAAYQDADLFVLPTHSENFGMTIAESLAAGTPTIVTRGAPWAGLESQRAGWWINIGLDPLVACLEQALCHSPQELAEMGRAGRAWMIREYSWHRVAEMMAHTYRWLISGGNLPAWVRVT